MTPTLPGRPAPAAVLGCAALLTIGWTGLLIPSLIRSIKESFGQTDAGIGLIYLLYAVAYAAGSFGGGPLVERLGRRRVLATAAVVHGIGIACFGLAPSWPVFVALALPAGLGGGALDGGSNGLFLELFPTGRGRAMNLLHMFFSLGALSAPLVVGALVGGGVAWPGVFVGSGIVALALAAGFGLAEMPTGRTHRASVDGPGLPTEGPSIRRRASLPLILLGVAIFADVAAEVGVSNWLVRFLEPAPLSTATLALSLFWAGLTLGRLASAALADRFDHVRFTTASALLMAAALLGAILVPSLPISIALFAITGMASGPIVPMIVAVGGDRYADRAAAVSGLLTGFAVVGGTIYPPLMGVLSVTVGLTIAMAGNVVLGVGCAAALVALRRRTT